MKFKNYAILLLPLLLFITADAARSPRETANDAVAAARTSRSAVPARNNARISPRSNADNSARENSTAITSRSAVSTRSVQTRTNSPTLSSRSALPTSRTILRKPTATTAARAGTNVISRSAVARSAVDTASVSGGDSGAYQECKTALFDCMDQFCLVKNEEYQRCSCSDTITSIQDARAQIEQAQDNLVAVGDKLSSVTLTAQQAAALTTGTQGEIAAANNPDTSKNQGILDSIMATIGGGASSQELKTGQRIQLDIDTTGFFSNEPTAVSGFDVSNYNGRQLYNVVFNQCKPMVAGACGGKGHLDRAAVAYDMVVEQDCSALTKALKSSGAKLADQVRQTSVNLSAARIEDYDIRNELTEAECLSEIKVAMLGDSACGPGYKNCMDNGQFIDQSTGKFLPSAVDLGQFRDMITFSTSSSPDVSDRIMLSTQGMTLRKLVEAKFEVVATPILDRCNDIRNQVRVRYLDLAMSEIHFAQMAKLEEFRGICAGEIKNCYDKYGPSLKQLASDARITNILEVYLSKDVQVALSTQEMCMIDVYRCDEVFGDNLVEDFVEIVTDLQVNQSCEDLIRDCYQTLGGPQYLNLMKPNPARGMVFEVGRGKQAILQGAGRVLDELAGRFTRGIPGVEYDSLCWSIYSNVGECKQVLHEQDYYNKFGVFYFEDDGRSRILDTFDPIEPQLDPATMGVAGEVYKSIQGELYRQCKNRGGEYVPLKAPYSAASDIYTISMLNNVAKERLAASTRYGLGACATNSFIEISKDKQWVECFDSELKVVRDICMTKGSDFFYRCPKDGSGSSRIKKASSVRRRAMTPDYSTKKWYGIDSRTHRSGRINTLQDTGYLPKNISVPEDFYEFPSVPQCNAQLDSCLTQCDNYNSNACSYVNANRCNEYAPQIFYLPDFYNQCSTSFSDNNCASQDHECDLDPNTTLPQCVRGGTPRYTECKHKGDICIPCVLNGIQCDIEKVNCMKNCMQKTEIECYANYNVCEIGNLGYINHTAPICNNQSKNSNGYDICQTPESELHKLPRADNGEINNMLVFTDGCQAENILDVRVKVNPIMYNGQNMSQTDNPDYGKVIGLQCKIDKVLNLGMDDALFEHMQSGKDFNTSCLFYSEKITSGSNQDGINVVAKNVCPTDWESFVDVFSWGICKCEHGTNAQGMCNETDPCPTK